MPRRTQTNRSDAGDEQEQTTTRRGLLRTASVAAVGTAALGAAGVQTAAAEPEITEVDLRGGAPPVSEGPQNRDEVVFCVHGYAESSLSVRRARQFRDTARELGYEGAVTAVTWNDFGFPPTAEGNARDDGETLAEWIGSFREATPDTTIRLLGYSMGGIVVMETLRSIDGAFSVANADMIGSYVRASTPCEESVADAIEQSCVGMYNYWSARDGVARLGSSGAACSSVPAANYTDVDATDTVSGHIDYRQNTDCVEQILDNHEDGESTEPVAVSTGAAEDVTQTSATVAGTLDRVGGDATTVAFQYREEGADEWQLSETTELSEPQSYTEPISELTPETAYQFRAVAGTGEIEGTGAVKSFTTADDDGETAPTIDSLDVESDCYWSCFIDTTWTVTAGSAELSTVETELYNEEDEQIDSDSTDVSGSDASGEHDVRAGWFDDPGSVVLRVTDEDGNSTTAQREQ